MIRSLFVLTAGAALTLGYAGWIVLTKLAGRPRTEAQCEAIGRSWSRKVLRVAGVRVRLEEVAPIDWDQALIVVSNHQSWFDVWALTAYLPARARFVAKEELARIPIFGAAWQACGHIAVNRGDRSQAVQSLDHAGERVREKKLAVILFPEGTRSPDGRLQPFKKGAFVLALQTGVPLLPVAILGSRHVMRKGEWRVRPGEIVIRAGAPIPVEGMDLRDRNALMARGRQEILALSGEVDHTTSNNQTGKQA